MGALRVRSYVVYIFIIYTLLVVRGGVRLPFNNTLLSVSGVKNASCANVEVCVNSPICVSC